MVQYAYESSTKAFEALYDEIMLHGTEISGTKALYNVGFTILHPTQREITTEWRKWNKKYAEREWSWYLSRNRSVEEIKKYAPIWDKMHNGNNIVNSNYGWQWSRAKQLDKCIEQLKKDPFTRQAWISIFDGKEKKQYEFDTPCTLAIGFDIKKSAPNFLNMTILMRSNDLIYGFCNDQYCFSMLQEYVANELNKYCGTYYHYAHNLHIYESHFNLKEKFYGSN